MPVEDKKPKNYLDILSGECRALAERFRLSGEQSDTLRHFVTDTAMRSWRNGRATDPIRWSRWSRFFRMGRWSMWFGLGYRCIVPLSS